MSFSIKIADGMKYNHAILYIQLWTEAMKNKQYLNSNPTPNHIHGISCRHGYDTSTGSSPKAQYWSKLSILCST
jgi:hypothetical protein